MDDLGMIKLIISTLNEVEVKGAENMSRLLGCINALTEMIKPKDGEDDG